MNYLLSCFRGTNHISIYCEHPVGTEYSLNRLIAAACCLFPVSVLYRLQRGLVISCEFMRPSHG